MTNEVTKLYTAQKVVGFFKLAKNHLVILFSDGLLQHIVNNVVDPPEFEQLSNAFGSVKDVGKQAHIETVVYMDCSHLVHKTKRMVIV